MDDKLKQAIELAIETGTLEDAHTAAILASDHWSFDMRLHGADLKDAIQQAHHASQTEIGHCLMDVENLLTDAQDTLDQVAR